MSENQEKLKALQLTMEKIDKTYGHCQSPYFTA